MNPIHPKTAASPRDPIDTIQKPNSARQQIAQPRDFQHPIRLVPTQVSAHQSNHFPMPTHQPQSAMPRLAVELPLTPTALGGSADGGVQSPKSKGSKTARSILPRARKTPTQPLKASDDVMKFFTFKSHIKMDRPSPIKTGKKTISFETKKITQA